MKKLLALMLSATMLSTVLVGCGSSDNSSASQGTNSNTSGQNNSEDGVSVDLATGRITVISREDGSGTRGAFTEITGVDDGNEDRTTVDANIQDSTGKIMTEVSSNPQGMGYISLGSLNETVKVVEVNGIYPSIETISSGEYEVARPFNIATKTGVDLHPIAQELLDFIFSSDGQDIALSQGYIAVEATTDNFETANPSGSISVGGSTSVYPLMEKFVEAYNEINPNAKINLEGVGSSSGMNGAIDGTFDIGMASREMKDSELLELTGMPCALDGIVIIVNNQNPLSGITMEELMNVYIGEITTFDEIAQ